MKQTEFDEMQTTEVNQTFLHPCTFAELGSYSWSRDTDLIMVPGASQELLDLLVDILYGGGEETKLYSSIVKELRSWGARS